MSRRPVQETVRSAVKPPRAKPVRQPLPWEGWRQLARAHPALLNGLRRPSDPPHRRHTPEDSESDYLVSTDALWLAAMIWLGLGIVHDELLPLGGAAVMLFFVTRR